MQLKSDELFYFPAWKLFFLQIGFQIYLFIIMNNCVENRSNEVRGVAIMISFIFTTMFWLFHLLLSFHLYDAVTSFAILKATRQAYTLLCPHIKPIDLIFK